MPRVSGSNSDSERAKLIREGLEKKKRCDERALEIVERLLTSREDRDWVRGAVNLISVSHYNDVVEERFILKTCGYPLCKEILVNIPKQQFKISLKTNQVFDLEERKMFCSNRCFKSSNYLKEQISTTPLWLRVKSDRAQIKFMDDDDLSNKSDQTRLQTNVVALKPDFGEIDNGALTVEKPPSVIEEKSEETKKRTHARPRTVHSSKEIVNILDTVRSALKMWWTSTSTSSICGMTSFTDDCDVEKGHINQLVEDISSVKITEELKKVDAFYKGGTCYQIDNDIKVVEKKAFDKDPVLPLLDKTAQTALRRTIVLQQIEKAFLSTEPVLNITWRDVKSPIKQLVHTFQLSAKNIVFKQCEWVMVCIFLLHALALSDNNIEVALQQPEANQFIGGILKSFDFSQPEVTSFIRQLLEPVTTC